MKGGSISMLDIILIEIITIILSTIIFKHNKDFYLEIKLKLYVFFIDKKQRVSLSIFLYKLYKI